LVVDEAGRFEAVGVPRETVHVSVRVPGYCLSRRNVSVDLLNGRGSVEGVVDRDIAGLTLELEPGKATFPETEEARREASDAYNLNRTRRLQGVPPEPVSEASPTSVGNTIPL
jgi:hypothetical protein